MSLFLENYILFFDYKYGVKHYKWTMDNLTDSLEFTEQKTLFINTIGIGTVIGWDFQKNEKKR